MRLLHERLRDGDESAAYAYAESDTGPGERGTGGQPLSLRSTYPNPQGRHARCEPMSIMRASTASEPRDRPAFAPQALRRGLAVALSGGGSAPATRRARARVGESEGRSPSAER